MLSCSLIPLPTHYVFRSPVFRVEYQTERVPLQCGVEFRLEIDTATDTSVYNNDQQNNSECGVFLEVDLFFSADETAESPDLRYQQTRRFKLGGLSDFILSQSVENVARSAILHEMTYICFDGVFFSTCDLIVSAACLGVQGPDETSYAAGNESIVNQESFQYDVGVHPRLSASVSDAGCGSGASIWQWLGHKLFGTTCEPKPHPRASKYMADPEKLFEDVLKDNLSIHASRLSTEYGDLVST